MTPDDLKHLLASKQALEDRERADSALSARLRELRQWQANRLQQTYSELRDRSRFVAALDFFLTDLYGPGDFARRDADLKRVLPRLQRALPANLLEVLRMALELQVLSLDLDQAMAAALPAAAVDADSYAATYRAVGRADDRRRQIGLIVQIGNRLGSIVGRHWIEMALRAAHVPARLAGLGALQNFLERGFRAFDRMGDPRELLSIIEARETKLMEALLSGDSQSLCRPAARSMSQ